MLDKEKPMSTIAQLEAAGLHEDFLKLLDESFLIKTKVEEFVAVIDEHGLKDEKVMHFIAEGMKHKVLNPGLYKKLVELNMGLDKFLASSTEPSPVEDQVDAPIEEEQEQVEEVEEDEPIEAAEPTMIEPEPTPEPKPKRKRVPKTVPATTSGLDKIYRRSSQGFRVLETLLKPRTMDELEELAEERGYTKKRLHSTLAVLNRPKERWYLPRYGWELDDSASRGGMTLYQLKPIKGE